MIGELGAELSGNAKETIDATGLHVFPGVIDPHVHFNEPGRTEWEGFATGSSALAAGGGTMFFDMPLNSSPPVLDGESFDLKLAAASKNSFTDFALWGGLTPKNLDKMEELAERGVVGCKAKQLGLPVAVHAESDAITAALATEQRSAGGRDWKAYLASRPIVAEVEA